MNISVDEKTGAVTLEGPEFKLEISEDEISIDTRRAIRLRGRAACKLDRPGLPSRSVNAILNALGEKS